MEKQHCSFLKQKFVRKQNDKINKVVDIIILGWDKKIWVREVRHQEIAWDVYNHKNHFIF
jgi:hypothetical protein